MLNEQDQRQLLLIARRAIITKSRDSTIDALTASDGLKEKKGVFVTLTKGRDLRGCQGIFQNSKPLYELVPDVAYSSAYEDPRVPSIEPGEFKAINVEISVLEPNRLLEYADDDELIQILGDTKPGVYIMKEGHNATYLPKVWEKFDHPVYFLSSLCQKGRMRSTQWQKKGVTVFTYTAQVFKE